MKNKKLLSIVSAVLAGTLMLTCAGCNTKKQDDGKVHITVSQWPSKEADPKKYETMMNYKENFEKKYPDIEIVPDEWNYELQTFNAKAEGGTLPTVYQAFLTEAKRINENGYAYDVTDLLKQYGYYDKISDFFMDTISLNGKVYHIPGQIYSLGLCINLDVMKEAGLVNADGTPQIPKTFDEVRSMSKTIKEKTGKAGFVMPSTGNYGGWIFTSLAWNFGTEFMKQDKNGEWVATFNSPETENALKYIYDMKWEDDSLPANTLVSAENCTSLVGTGQAAMSIMNITQVNSLPRVYGMDKDSIVFAKLPAGPEGHYTLMGGGTYIIAPNATPEQADAAMKWLEFIGILPTEDEESIENLRASYQQSYDEGVGIIGIHKLNAWKSDYYFETHGHYLEDEFLNVDPSHVADYNDPEGIDYHVEEPVCTQELYSIFDKCLQEVMTNKNADIKSLLESSSAEFQSNYLDYAD